MRANLRAATLVLAAAGFTSAAQAAQVDLLMFYDDASNNIFKGQAQAAMTSWVQQLNHINQNSHVDINYRLVGIGKHQAPGANLIQALQTLFSSAGPNFARSASGADFVVQFKADTDGNRTTGLCGVAQQGVSKNAAFAVVHPECGPLALAHEMGHLLGLGHSLRESGTRGLRYHYGVGYGIDNNFSDLMATPEVFGTAKWLPIYSTPRVFCWGNTFGAPCGIPNVADAAAAIYNVRDEVANFMHAPPPRTVTVFQHYRYGGRGSALPAGSYRLADLRRRWVQNDDLSSARVPPGMRLELYEHDNFKGRVAVVLADNPAFPRGINDTTSSIIVKGR